MEVIHFFIAKPPQIQHDLKGFFNFFLKIRQVENKTKNFFYYFQLAKSMDRDEDNDPMTDDSTKQRFNIRKYKLLDEQNYYSSIVYLVQPSASTLVLLRTL
jgi:hypothetical protein